MSDVITATQVGVRYGRNWALRDCSFSLPPGRIIGLVGPNGSGKTTLLHLAIGLLQPTTGTITVLGARPGTGSTAILPRIGFVAQSHPLYASFTVAEMVTMGRKLNSRWDDGFARARLAQLGIPLNRRCGTLSGGQQAQVALVLALAKQPDLLLLDEPVASLDPLARHELLGVIMELAAERQISIILSSHIITELERVCDTLLLLVAGSVRIQGSIDELLAEHLRITGPAADLPALEHHHPIISAQTTDSHTTAIIRKTGPVFGSQWQTNPIALEDLVLAYLGQSRDQAVPLTPMKAEVHA